MPPKDVINALTVTEELCSSFSPRISATHIHTTG